MKLLNYINFNFSFDFFKNHTLHPFYTSIFNPFTNKTYTNKDFREISFVNKNIHEIKFIPSFFQLKHQELPSNYNIIKYKRIENFFIDLQNFSSAENFLKSQMGSKSRSQLRRRIHRLENCFDIQYKFYFGEITKQNYDKLFDHIEVFINRRFIQRNDIFSHEKNMSNIRKNSFQMILDKKASLFVIYADRKIIDVCLNYHFQNVVQHFIRSYDIDYSKFWIGQIDIYKQIEVCIEHNFTIFDFMWDELLYKKRWSNTTTIYEHHFIYKKNNPLKKPIVLLMIGLYKLNDSFKTTSFYKSFINFKKSLFNKNAKKPTQLIITIKPITEVPKMDSLKKIDIENKNYLSIRKTVYDFQYLNFEASKNIEVFQLKNSKNNYIIKSNKAQIKAAVN